MTIPIFIALATAVVAFWLIYSAFQMVSEFRPPKKKDIAAVIARRCGCGAERAEWFFRGAHVCGSCLQNAVDEHDKLTARVDYVPRTRVWPRR
jgi:hypothetical protein